MQEKLRGLLKAATDKWSAAESQLQKRSGQKSSFFRNQDDDPVPTQGTPDNQ
jgi:hypothetical protein